MPKKPPPIKDWTRNDVADMADTIRRYVPNALIETFDYGYGLRCTTPALFQKGRDIIAFQPPRDSIDQPMIQHDLEHVIAFLRGEIK